MAYPVEIIAWQPKNLGPVINFDPDEFRRTVFTDGTPMTWEKAIECPCAVTKPDVDPDNTTRIRIHGTHNQDCPRCKGRGRFYVNAQDIHGLIYGASRDKQLFAVYGALTKGMANITLLPEHLPSEWDRYTLTETIIQIQETRERRWTVEQMFYPIASVPLELGASGNPNNKIVTDVDGVMIFRADSDGQIVSDALVAGTHYTILSDGRVQWQDPGTKARGVVIVTVDTENGGAAPAGTIIPRGTVIPSYASTLAPEDVPPGAEEDFPWAFVDYVFVTDCVIGNTGGDILGGFAIIEAMTAGVAGNMPPNTKYSFTVDGEAFAFDVDAAGLPGGVDPDEGEGGVGIGEWFTIRYFAHPRYIVHSIPHSHRDTFTRKLGSDVRTHRRMPVQATTWMEHKGNPDEPLPQGTNEAP
jgi:hypothetical protein